MSRPCPVFLITIDTEGDDAWSKPQRIQTRNAAFLPRFQALCDRHGLPPTYLVNHEMATAPALVSMARAALSAGVAEVGMHLHAWDSPPITPLTDADHRLHPYLIDFPPDRMAAKIDHMTSLLEDTFGVPMRSHRAGRWAFNETYARLLVERGYGVDCSVTPGHSWAHVAGAPGRFGSDYTEFPDQPYFVDLQDIRRSGDSALLELPMTIRRSAVHRKVPWAYRAPVLGPVVRRLAPALSWLRPNGRNLNAMLEIVEWARRTHRPYLEFMIHSSELMPGGSPYFRDEAAIEKLYVDLEALFGVIREHFKGCTLSAFRDAWAAGTGASITDPA